MLSLYTIQLSNWRLAAERNIPLLDTSVKTGNTAFSPSWDILMDYKKTGDWSKYVSLFEPKMALSEIIHYDEWDSLTRHTDLAIGCYCKPGANCHRHLLVPRIIRFMADRGIPATYVGELQ